MYNVSLVPVIIKGFHFLPFITRRRLLTFLNLSFYFHLIYVHNQNEEGWKFDPQCWLSNEKPCTYGISWCWHNWASLMAAIFYALCSKFSCLIDCGLLAVGVGWRVAGIVFACRTCSNVCGIIRGDARSWRLL